MGESDSLDAALTLPLGDYLWRTSQCHQGEAEVKLSRAMPLYPVAGVHAG